MVDAKKLLRGASTDFAVYMKVQLSYVKDYVARSIYILATGTLVGRPSREYPQI